MTYEVFYEIYGMKKRTKVDANNETEAITNARNKVADSVIIYKVKRDIDPEVENLMNLIGMKP